jgi:hypothetical protein
VIRQVFPPASERVGCGDGTGVRCGSTAAFC